TSCVRRNAAVCNRVRHGAGAVIPGFFKNSRKCRDCKSSREVCGCARRNKYRSQGLSNLLKQAFVDCPLCFQSLNALHNQKPQLRISLLGLQVRTLWDWSVEDLIPRSDFESCSRLVRIQESYSQPFWHRPPQL